MLTSTIPKIAFPQYVTHSHTRPYSLLGVIPVNDPLPGRLHQNWNLQSATAVTTAASSVFLVAFSLGGGYRWDYYSLIILNFIFYFSQLYAFYMII